MAEKASTKVRVEVETSSGIMELEFRGSDPLNALAQAKERLREAHARIFHQWYRKMMEGRPDSLR